MKKILLSLALLSTVAPALGMEKNQGNGKSEKQEVEEKKDFPFFSQEMPRDIQNEILKWCYKNKNKDDQKSFNKDDQKSFNDVIIEFCKKEFKNNDNVTFSEMCKYGFYRSKLPILYYDTSHKKPLIRQAGIIITCPYTLTRNYGAYPPQLFLQTREGILHAELKSSNPLISIEGCTITKEGLLAIHHTYNKAIYYSFCTLEDIKNNTIDLDATAMEFEKGIEINKNHLKIDYGLRIDPFIVFDTQNRILKVSKAGSFACLYLLSFPLPDLKPLLMAKQLMLPTTALKEYLALKKEASAKEKESKQEQKEDLEIYNCIIQ